MERIIALVDMDCFYVQVEQKLDPSLQGLPCAVIQYNEWEGGAIIAVNYEARKFGVKRPMRGNVAKALCPEIKLAQVPVVNEKADLTRYREAGAEVIDVLKQFNDKVERASVDEAYIDLTEEVNNYIAKNSEECVMIDDLESSHIIGWNSNDLNGKDEEQRKESLKSWLKDIFESNNEYQNHIRLAVGAKIMEKIRLAILEQTQYKCSAGIAHNKIIAKLCCGLNKPNKQTIVPHSSIPHLYSSIPVKKVRGFGGKFGDDVMEKLGVTLMSDLETFSENFLQSKFGDKSGKWLYDISRGFEYEEVCSRLLPKSLGCSKNFMGKSALKSKEQVKCWYKTLSMELEERLTKDKQNNKRVAKHLTVGMTTLDESKRRVVVTRSLPILSYSVSKLHVDAFQSLSKVNIAPKNSDDWMPPVINVCMTAGKFEDDSGTNCSSIKNFFLPSTSQTLNHNRTHKEVNSAENELKTNEVPNEPQNHDSIGKSQEMINFLANELGNLSEKSESSTSENSKSCNQFTSPSKLSENNIKDRPNIKSGKNKNLLKDMLEKARSKEISYKSCELTVNSIDSDVLENLPADIRQEILQHLENSGGQDNANHLDDNQHKKCDKCGENVKISQLTEHLDFHLAKELSREMNSTSSTSMSTHLIDSKPGKRSLQPKGNQNKKAKVNCKKINSYFK